jgi:hypothetical protein
LRFAIDEKENENDGEEDEDEDEDEGMKTKMKRGVEILAEGGANHDGDNAIDGGRELFANCTWPAQSPVVPRRALNLNLKLNFYGL